MEQAIQLISLVVYVGLTVVALSFANRQRSSAGTWAAATFCDLGLIVVLGALQDEVAPTSRMSVAGLYQDAVVLLLVLFPYLLHRFVRALREPRAAIDRAVDAAAAALTAWTLIAPPIPAADAPQPGWVAAYTGAFLLWWGLVFAVVSWELWRMGRGQPGVIRSRMRLMSVAAVLMNLALLISVLGGGLGPTSTYAVAAAVLGWGAAGLFLIGLRPPRTLRRLWRGTDETVLRQAEVGLLSATTYEVAAQSIIGAAAWVVGGSSARITDRDGQPLASVGDVDDGVGPRLSIDGFMSTMTVRPGRLTPVLGQDEEELLGQLSTHLHLALTRIEAMAASIAALADAERANDDLQQLVYGVSHDLRNPLVTITGFLQLLGREQGLTEQGRMLIDRMSSSAKYMDSLVSDLLQLSRVGHADSERTTVRLDEVVGSIVEDLSDRYPALTVDRDPLPDVHMNPVRARQLFANVIENAARYAHRDGQPVHVAVTASTTGRMAVIDVADDGEGIPPEQRERVFQIFQRLNGFDARSEGSGIGLTMCRRITGEVGGSITVADAPRGTTMRITLPLPAHAPAPARSHATASELGPVEA